MLPGKEVRVSGWRSVASGALRWTPTSGVVGLAVVLSFVPACGSHAAQGPGLDAATDTSHPGDSGGEAPADAAHDGDAGPGVDAPPDVAPPDGGHTEGGADGMSTDAWAIPDSLPFDATLGTDPTACHAMDNTAPIIEPQMLAADVAVPSSFSGGTIADGRYELISVDFYPASNAPAPQPYYQRTLVFQGNATRGLMVDLSKVPRGWVVGHPSFAVTVTPAAMLTETGDTCASGLLNEYLYEVSAGMLTFWYPKGGTLQRYLLVP
jgi:hypothetical protein